ncbi:SURF1 family protein [Noviherbaspirillum aridicola]|uniref:SURF1-like protein n=1 Tax=Noviherbaspirillum aridicola TaxID=2849687 RepID=A0ABQ4PZJ0_9BURK|nr:SURF1 family protein [Noviherbaspirillum aridicola]GIZ50318.1 SURF1-like protein [Noviherbaspirillum aridicola]
MPEPASAPSARVGKRRLALVVLALLAFSVFVALGTWQLQRLQWKLTLIERVGQRVNADPADAPGPPRWPSLSAETDEYRRVRLEGRFLYDKTSLVQAATARGAGFWVLTPLRTAEGWTVLINRGFIPVDATGRMAPLNDAGKSADAEVVTGLLRITEPGGGFLRSNDPAGGRWYSRDVQAIAAAHGLQQAAPYFIDADASTAGAAPGQPVGGLTVVSFRNNHLVYALTWYALALMVAGASVWVWRTERRRGGRPGLDREEDDDSRD